MRNRYLVCYDVSDPWRLAHLYRKMNGFGQPVQDAVFLCDLSPKERGQLEAALTEILNVKEDRVLVIDAGPTEGRGLPCLASTGKAIALPSRSALVV